MTYFYRKVIRITAEDSPNVKLALAQLRAGQLPTNEIVVPGVLPWADYLKRRQTWDPVRQCVGLDAQFWEGAEALLYPPSWMARAEAIAAGLAGVPRRAKGIGVDPAEGGDKTVLAVVDERGLIEMYGEYTPDTGRIPILTLNMMKKYGVAAECVVFDRGGGGKQHADAMRRMGHRVRTVSFGEPVVPPPRRGMVPVKQRMEDHEERMIYKNRRAEMYGVVRQLLDPSTPVVRGLPDRQPGDGLGFGLPAFYHELRRQLSVIPIVYENDKLVLPPKHRTRGTPSSMRTLVELIGHSPDEADAFVMAVYAMLNKVVRTKVGALA